MSGAPRDVVVVGGGVIGCAIALAAAERGLSVLLLERNEELGREASRAAAGMLAPQMEEAAAALHGDAVDAPDDALLGLCLASRDRYGPFVERVEEATGRDTGHRVEGTLVVALDPASADALERVGASQRERGLRATGFAAVDARRLEPALASRVTGALLLPDDHRIDTRVLVDAVAAMVEGHASIEVRTGVRVAGVAIDGSRVAAVTTEGGRVAAGSVVVAAGAWSGRLDGLSRRVPIRPVKGQMGAVETKTSMIRTVFGPGAYCVPRGDGRILVGATMEEAGFDLGVDSDVVGGVLRRASRFLPPLAGAGFVETWAGLRPATPDGRPILGADPAVKGLVWATGHHRNGILLAPVTAEAVAAILAGEEPEVDLAPFAPDRAALMEP